MSIVFSILDELGFVICFLICVVWHLGVLILVAGLRFALPSGFRAKN